MKFVSIAAVMIENCERLKTDFLNIKRTFSIVESRRQAILNKKIRFADDMIINISPYKD
jgi:hypothetical protein